MSCGAAAGLVKQWSAQNPRWIARPASNLARKGRIDRPQWTMMWMPGRWHGSLPEAEGESRGGKGPCVVARAIACAAQSQKAQIQNPEWHLPVDQSMATVDVAPAVPEEVSNNATDALEDMLANHHDHEEVGRHCGEHMFNKGETLTPGKHGCTPSR